jgi:hypothetical protein
VLRDLVLICVGETKMKCTSPLEAGAAARVDLDEHGMIRIDGPGDPPSMHRIFDPPWLPD